MSLHHAPLHRPTHHLTSAEGMIILIVASVVVLLVIAALTMPVATTTNRPAGRSGERFRRRRAGPPGISARRMVRQCGTRRLRR